MKLETLQKYLAHSNRFSEVEKNEILSLYTRSQTWASEAKLCAKREAYGEATIKFEKSCNLLQDDPLKQIDILDEARASRNRDMATSLYSSGDTSKAIKHYKLAKGLYEKDGCRTRPELDPDRAKTSAILASALSKNGDHNGAIQQSHHTLELLQEDYCRDRQELDLTRAKTTEILASALMSNGDKTAALEQYQKSQNLLTSQYCAAKAELDPLRANLAIILGNILNDTGDHYQAIEQYQYAQSILGDDFCSEKLELDPLRAQIPTGLAAALGKIGDRSNTIGLLQKALDLYQGDYCRGRAELVSRHSATILILADALRGQGDNIDAIEHYKKANTLLHSDACKNQPELDTSRVYVSINLAITLSDIGYIADAIKELKRAETMLQSKDYRSRQELDPDRAKVATSLANIIEQTGDNTGAVEKYQYAQALYEAEYCQERVELDPERARVALSLANSLKMAGDHAGAIEQYSRAQFIYHGEHCCNLPELDSNRADAILSLADYSLQNGDPKNGIVQYRQALSLLNGDYCKNQTTLDPMRAVASMRLGISLLASNAHAEGYELVQYCCELWENKIESYWLPQNIQRFWCYAAASNFLTHFPDSQSWTLEKSQIMARMLELAPDDGAGGTLEQSWQSVRKQYMLFHKNWLKHCTNTKDFEFIPKIILAIQGRELATEILDEWSDQKYSELPVSLQEYIEIRKDLRDIVQHSHSGETRPSSLRGDSITTQQNEHSSEDLRLSDATNSINTDKFDSEQYNDLQTKLSIARTAAAQEPGFENIFPDPKHFSLDALQSSISLPNRQALLLMIQLDDQMGLLLIRTDSKCIWIEGGNFTQTLTAIKRLYLSCEQGNLRGRFRRMSYQQAQTEYSKRDLDEQALKATQLSRFWPEMISEVTTSCWNPLLPHLSNIEELIILPQGDFHSFPLLAGKPSNITLIFYPGLIFYAMKRGLLSADNAPENEIQSECNVGLLCYSAKNVNESHLPGVDIEIRKIRHLYSERLPENNIELLKSPNPYPQKSLSLDVFHFAGHGSVDPNDLHSTSLLIGGGGAERQRMLGVYDILTGKAKVKHAYIGACTAGRIRDNSQGTPLGITTSLLRKGTHSVTAALMPIDDNLASQFGYLWHTERITSLLEDNTINPNAILKRTQLALLKYYKEEYIPRLRDLWMERIKSEFGNARASFRLKDTTINQVSEVFRLTTKQVAQFRNAEKHICGVKDGLFQRLSPFLERIKIKTPKIKSSTPSLKVSPQAKATHMINMLDRMGCFSVDIREQGSIPIELGIMLYCYRVYGE